MYGISIYLLFNYIFIFKMNKNKKLQIITFIYL